MNEVPQRSNCSVRHESCFQATVFPPTAHVLRCTPPISSPTCDENLRATRFVAASASHPCRRPGRYRRKRRIALLSIQRHFQECEAAYESAISALAPGREAADQGQSLTTTLRKKQADLFMSAVDLAKENPKSAAGFAALEWILKDVRSYYHPAGALAFELLALEYANRPAIGRVDSSTCLLSSTRRRSLHANPRSNYLKR